LAISLLALYAVLDFFLAFPQGVRIAIDLALLACLATITVWQLAGIFRLGEREMAIRADRLLSNRRRATLSGLELSAEIDALDDDGAEEMRVFLLERGVQRCYEALQNLRLARCFPKQEILRQLKVLGIQILIIAIVFAAGRNATATIMARIFTPARDVPPYSRYVFRIEPAVPEVVYGDNIEVKVEIGGPAPDSRVWMLTRYGDERHRAACFQESDRVFAQRMEKVVVPLEFCFKTGKARSRWHSLDLRLQPRVAFARATITPPEYTRLPARDFYLGRADFDAYRNSESRLELVSNRPLLDGSLTIRPNGLSGAERIVSAEKTGVKSVAFEWVVEGDAELEISLRDIRGTGLKTPLIVKQSVIEDEPPNVVVTEPGVFVLATPSISIPFKGYAEDDLGLSRVELLRTLLGYRDRAIRLGPQVASKRFDIDRELDLKRIGAEPGQELELYLEAGDCNPTLMGIAASSVVRIKIISEREYAENLRMQETLENFLARYRMVSATLDELRKTLGDLRKDLEDESMTESQTEQRVRAARERLKEIQEELYRLGDDFPLYEMEKELNDFARETGTQVGQMSKQLSTAGNDRSALKQQLDRMLESLGASEEIMAEQKRDVREVARIRRLMECAGEFMSILQRQRDLVRRLKRFENEDSAGEARLLEALGEEQARNRDDLLKLVADIRERSAEIGDLQPELRRTALQFADAVEGLEIPATMRQAVAAAAEQDGGSTLNHAALARDKLERLLSGCEGGAFGGMCRNELKFSIPKPSMQMTVSQMMQAMGAGAGRGNGSGAGSGGVGSDGYAMQGYSPMNIPMFGPERIARSFGGFDGGGAGRGEAGGGGSSARVAESEQFSGGDGDSPRGQSLPLETVPEKYIESVKKYFSIEGAEYNP